MSDPTAGVEFCQPKVGILMDRDGTQTPGLARDELQFSGRNSLARLFGIARRRSFEVGLNPDLEKMHGFVLCRVEFAVLNAGACSHVLHVPGMNNTAIT